MCIAMQNNISLIRKEIIMDKINSRQFFGSSIVFCIAWCFIPNTRFFLGVDLQHIYHETHERKEGQVSDAVYVLFR